MNGLILFLGESFRLGNQGTRNRGSLKSYDEQINACNSHIRFIEHIIKKYQLNKIDVYISSYTTQYDNDLLSIYNKYLLGHIFHANPIGLNNLFHSSLDKIKNYEYDFILFIRIDLFLKDYFMEVFNPKIDIILFPTICFIPFNISHGDPRVNDMLIFIPKKYYRYLRYIEISHDSWHKIIKHTNLCYDDMDTMINTYHDSDSNKDFNPLYYIVNREENKIFHSEGHIFDKKKFN